MKNFELYAEELTHQEMLSVVGGNSDDDRDSDDGDGVFWQ